MELAEIKEEMEKGVEFWAAAAPWEQYSGSLVDGYTTHILITADSQPNLALSSVENESLGLIKRVEPLYSKRITNERWEVPFCEKGMAVYVNDAPFKVWVRHVGHTGDRIDDYDKIIEAKRITSISELLRMINSCRR
jgi:hypothetical protein